MIKFEICNGNGGVFYTSITGNVWASGAESSAKTLTNLINKSLKDNCMERQSDFFISSM